MNLTERPTFLRWPPTHYLYVERTGPFATSAPQAWQAMHQRVPSVAAQHAITGYTSLYKVRPTPIYRAGVSVARAPQGALPEGVSVTHFAGGLYARYVLVGPYENLPAASGQIFRWVGEQGLVLRDDFYLENYVNDPRQVAPADLVTEIYVPCQREGDGS